MARKIVRVVPVLAVGDMEEALRFYRERLGFAVAWRWGEPTLRAGVALDDVEIQLVGPAPGQPSHPGVVLLHLTGIEEYSAFCRAAGAAMELDLGARPWGARDFRVLDPHGNRLIFSEATPGGTP